MNDTELRELLQDTPAPAMSIDTERVVQRGRQRVRNTRIKYAAGLTAAVVAIGAVVGFGTMRVGETTTPADPSRAHMGSLYKGMDADAKRGQFTAISMQDGGNTPTPVHTYRVTASGTVQRVDRGTTVTLHSIGTLAGGGVIVRDEKQTVVLYPVPRSAEQPDLVTVDSYRGSVGSGGGVRASNGDFYVAFVSSKPLQADQIPAVIWQDGSGGYDSSRGKGSSVTVQGTTLYVFPQFNVTGSNAGTRWFYSPTRVVADGFSATVGTGDPLRFDTQALLPQSAHDIRISYPSGWSGKQNLQCAPLPGTALQACLVDDEKATKQAQNAQTAPTVHWVDASGTSRISKS